MKFLLPRASFFVALLLPCLAWSENVPSVIDTDALWTSSNNPYIVSEDVTLSEGVTLEIEPGVRVEFATNSSLFVKGQLLSRGTETSKIIFTGVPGKDEPSRWGTIHFEDSSSDAVFEEVDNYQSGSILEFCTVEYASRALRLTAASPYIHQCSFEQNVNSSMTEEGGGAAIFIESGSSPRIFECTFSDNISQSLSYGGAIYVTQSSPIIQDNTFLRNSSIYGGAITTDLVASPIVGNEFYENEATASKGGAMSLISTISAVLNNVITGNMAAEDGAGIHVCVDCFPHSTPFFMDNTITENISANDDIIDGSAGFGAAFIRVFRDNNIYGNLRNGAASDFGWYHHESEGYADWVFHRNISNNWWGSTDVGFIENTIFDGHDNPEYGMVEFDPIRQELLEEAIPRVTITTRKLRYQDEGDDMPVFITIYNPGEEKTVDLSILINYEENPPIPYNGSLDFPGAIESHGSFVLVLPENSVYFSTLFTPQYGGNSFSNFGFWHAALFDHETGDRIGETSSIRFDFIGGE